MGGTLLSLVQRYLRRYLVGSVGSDILDICQWWYGPPLLRPGGSLNGSGDCYYSNCVGGALDWGYSTIPVTIPSWPRWYRGTGLRISYIHETGSFRVYVHDYPNVLPSGNPVTVVIYVGGSWSGDTRTISGETHLLQDILAMGTVSSL